MASIQRQPFGEIDSARLQGLAAQKNCQNAVTEMLSKPSLINKAPCLTSPAKRPYTPIFDDEQFDTENIDPNLTASKRSKGLDGKSKPMFSLNTTFTDATFKSTEKPSTPTSPLADKFSFSSSLPTATASAPAGRSPKHKRVGILSKKRNPASAIRRVDPPRFGASKKGSAVGLPFSIDAALSGTLSSYNAPAPAPAPSKSNGPSLNEPMPNGWFFDIHEDTPDEEAANLMEHSTCILDISSDDEAGASRVTDDRGKENVPPADHDAAVNANGQTVQESAAMIKSRRSVHVDAMVDDGQERAPLGALPAEDFYGKGLDARSVEVLAVEPDSSAEADVSKPQPASVSAESSVLVQGEDGNAEDAKLDAPVQPSIGHADDPPAVVVHEDEPQADAPSTEAC